MNNSPKILLVDSDPFMHRVYASRLMSHGYKILTANSPNDAIRVSHAENPDAVLCDAQAYGGRGINIINELQNNDGTSHIPILCVSNSWEEEHREEALSAGASIYGIKSHLTPTEIAAHIESLIA